jgi:hypothetical protein
MSLPRADNRDAMAALGQAVNDPAQRHGDAVYFGSVGFSDEGKMQIIGPGRRSDRPSSNPSVPGNCAETVTTG